MKEIELMKKVALRLCIPGLLIALMWQFQIPVSGHGGDASPKSDLVGSPYSTEWRITGPSGGDVRALVVDPSDPDRFYFGTLDGQIYMSIDAGRNWRLLYNFNRPNLFVDHIIVDPRNSKVLYLATQ